jgi:hypothetical protein
MKGVQGRQGDTWRPFLLGSADDSLSLLKGVLMRRFITGGLVGLALVLQPSITHADDACQAAVAQVWETPAADTALSTKDYMVGLLLVMGVVPGDVAGWQYSGTAPRCHVSFGYRLGGRQETMRWDVNTTAGTVTPTNAGARTAMGQ